ncbi:hypothetical protein NDU88_001307 [Pleurodeles waltl]|uniref:Uncharacterized protein n=1 Tax=Pleurodeles waltl TaxID=8319 RepID=A0AAV7NAI1_PLEWA|nr:hypothetical protein NDU88_001307 [Pleurodeles waltl]
MPTIASQLPRPGRHWWQPDLAGSVWKEKRIDMCSPCSARFLSHLPAFLRLPLLFFVPHPRTWSGHASPEAWRLFHGLPGVSSLHNGAPPAPTPTLFHSSGERFPRLRCRRPPEPSVLFRLKTPDILQLLFPAPSPEKGGSLLLTTVRSRGGGREPMRVPPSRVTSGVEVAVSAQVRGECGSDRSDPSQAQTQPQKRRKRSPVCIYVALNP